MFRILEVLDSKETAYTVTLDSRKHFHAMFRVGNMRYLFEAEFVGPEWEIKFSAYNRGQRTQSITDTGNAPLVFSAVGEVLREFIIRRQPEKFYFGGLSTRGRNSLYRRLAKSIADTFNYRLDIAGQVVIEYHFAKE